MRAVARLVGVSHVTVGTWETGKALPKPEDVEKYLHAIGVADDERQRILGLARDAGEVDGVVSDSPGVAKQLAAVLECERTATKITMWSQGLFPGLLQTGDYARVVMEQGDVPRDEAEGRIRLRIGRRDVLERRNAAHLVALIWEPVFEQRLGGPDVMLHQLDYLRRMASAPNVEVQVVPSMDRWHPGLMGPFVLYEFDDASPVVYIEHHRTGSLLYYPEDRQAIDDYRAAAEQLRELAMSADETLNFLDRTAGRISGKEVGA